MYVTPSYITEFEIRSHRLYHLVWHMALTVVKETAVEETAVRETAVKEVKETAYS